jgi:hypothetical protein
MQLFWKFSAKRPLVALLPAVVVLALLAPGRSEAGIIFSGSPGAFGPTAVFTVGNGNTNGTLSPTTPPSPTALSDGFSVGGMTLSYTSASNDKNKSVTVMLDFYYSASYTAGSYQTALNITAPIAVANGATLDTVSATAEFVTGTSATNFTVLGGQAGMSYSGPSTSTGGNQTFTGTFAPTSASGANTYFVLSETMVFTPTASGQVFSISLAGATATAFPAVGTQAVTPEPATLAMAGIGGLAGMFTYFRRRKAIAAA